MIRISEAFDVSLDYLAFEAINDHNEDERMLVKSMLNLVVMKHKFQNIALAQPDSIF